MLRFVQALALVGAAAVVQSPPCQAATSLFTNEVQVPRPEDMVPPSEAGQFLVEPIGKDELRLTVRGRTFISRAAAEKFLAYRAAEATLEQNKTWFTVIEAKGVAGESSRDKAGTRSFRMENWRPAWRYKLAGEGAWKTWSPYAAEPFFADGKDSKTITDFELTANIRVRSGKPDIRDPLAFEAEPLAQLLAAQVSPPQ